MGEMNSKEKLIELKNETINSLNVYINAESEEKTKYVDKICENIINKFMEIVYELKVPVNEEYIRSQMNITKKQIVDELQSGNEYLSEEIYLQFNKFTNDLIDETGNLKREKELLESIIDNKKQERKQQYTRIESMIDERIKDFISNTSKKLYNLQAHSEQETLEQLKYYINQVKKDETNKIVENLEIKDISLFNNIENRIENFFKKVEITKEQKEVKTETKSWELSEEEAKNINPQKAIEETEKSRISKKDYILDLPDNILK